MVAVNAPRAVAAAGGSGGRFGASGTTVMAACAAAGVTAAICLLLACFCRRRAFNKAAVAAADDLAAVATAPSTAPLVEEVAEEVEASVIAAEEAAAAAAVAAAAAAGDGSGGRAEMERKAAAPAAGDVTTLHGVAPATGKLQRQDARRLVVEAVVVSTLQATTATRLPVVMDDGGGREHVGVFMPTQSRRGGTPARRPASQQGGAPLLGIAPLEITHGDDVASSATAAVSATAASSSAANPMFAHAGGRAGVADVVAASSPGAGGRRVRMSGVHKAAQPSHRSDAGNATPGRPLPRAVLEAALVAGATQATRLVLADEEGGMVDAARELSAVMVAGDEGDDAALAPVDAAPASAHSSLTPMRVSSTRASVHTASYSAGKQQAAVSSAPAADANSRLLHAAALTPSARQRQRVEVLTGVAYAAIEVALTAAGEPAPAAATDLVPRAALEAIAARALRGGQVAVDAVLQRPLSAPARRHLAWCGSGLAGSGALQDDALYSRVAAKAAALPSLPPRARGRPVAAPVRPPPPAAVALGVVDSESEEEDAAAAAARIQRELYKAGEEPTADIGDAASSRRNARRSTAARAAVVMAAVRARNARRGRRA